jgi:hypothetical protein
MQVMLPSIVAYAIIYNLDPVQASSKARVLTKIAGFPTRR